MRSTWRRSDYEVGWAIHPTPVIKWLLIINCAVFCVQFIFGLLNKPSMFDTLFQLSPLAVSQGWLWQFFTYMFLHYGLLHLLFNLLALYFFGNEVESIMGSPQLLQMYLLGGVTGGFLWFIFNLGTGAAAVGASGAVYAVLIAFAVLFPNRPITLLIFFVLPVTMLAKYLAIALVAVSVLFSITGGDHIAHLAHLGGAAVGYFFVKGFGGESRWSVKFQWPQMKIHRSKKDLDSSSKKISKFHSPIKKDEFMQQRIDPILDKIAKQGISSLTPEERRLLEEAKERLS